MSDVLITVTNIIVVIGVVWALWRYFPMFLKDIRPCEKPEYPPKGWDEHKEIRKGEYRIVVCPMRSGTPYFGNKPLGEHLSLGIYRIEDCIKLCEEHRLKEEVKKEMAAEYGLEKK